MDTPNVVYLYPFQAEEAKEPGASSDKLVKYVKESTAEEALCISNGCCERLMQYCREGNLRPCDRFVKFKNSLINKKQ